MNTEPAQPWTTTRWFNSEPLTLEDLRGRVIVLGTFQMLCPGCVANGLPQLQRIVQTFNRRDVAVIGLHTVFEHHAAMTPTSLEAFLLEYRIGFPVGVDSHEDSSGTPITMTRYGLRGTPSLVLIDRAGLIRFRGFGHEPDLAVGARIAQLIAQQDVGMATAGESGAAVCVPGGECG
ncbi:peroxiredoxin family protein [Qipengyuania zhejiangensis]|uniref:peroxiredoxin family protein n=1 Tax=Qipengyuania zhejiangensis TaxID=3077782 RepID=UPI002D78945F|nr:redoxin domain-containing protein [Qipengyuania sp. Z2]